MLNNRNSQDPNVSSVQQARRNIQSSAGNSNTPQVQNEELSLEEQLLKDGKTELDKINVWTGGKLYKNKRESFI